MRVSARILAATAVVAATAILPGGARGDVRPLTLYQKTARASLVARVRAETDSTRRPPMEVLEVYKGADPGKEIFIVPFSQEYANPKPWLHREVFHKGQEYVLFLTPFERDADKAFQPEQAPKGEPGDDAPGRLFAVLNADQGISEVPAEGAPALIDAVRRFAAILALGQDDRQVQAIRGLLHERNPYLVEAGLTEVERFDLAEVSDLPTLLELLSSARDEFRATTLRIIGQVATAESVAGRDMKNRGEIFTHVVDRAYNDRSPGVRRDAVRALSAVGGGEATAVLRAISEKDSDQEVRYQAQVEILTRAPATPASTAPRRP